MTLWAKEMDTALKPILDNLYDFLSNYYLETYMLSISHEYKKHISNDPYEVGAVAFLSALYDFQMRVGLIRSRFLYIINYLMKKELGIFDLLNDKYLNDMQVLMNYFNIVLHV